MYTFRWKNNIPRVLETRDKLYTWLLNKYADKVLEGKGFRRLSDKIRELLGPEIREQRNHHIDQSLQYLLGTRVTGDQLREVLWRLAGNEQKLATGPVLPWSSSSVKEWVPAEIVRVRLRRGGRNESRVGYEITFQILAGSPCSLKTEKWWSRPLCYRMAYYRNDEGYGFGFQRQRAEKYDAAPVRYPFQHPQQFYGLRCMLLVDPDHCRDDLPGFKHIGFVSSLGMWNKGVHRKRMETPCPHRINRTLEPCHRCPIGSEDCTTGAATHRDTFVYMTCLMCGMVDAPFDPEDVRQDRCVRCRDELVLNK